MAVVRRWSDPALAENSPAVSAAAIAAARSARMRAAGLERNPAQAGGRRGRATVAGPIVGRSARRSCPGLTSLTSTPPGPGRARSGAARQHGVGALGRLHRQHEPLLHHAALADIRRTQRPRHLDPAPSYRPSPRRPAPARASTPAGASASCSISCAPIDAEALLAQHPDHRPQQPVVAGECGPADAGQHARALGVRPQIEARTGRRTGPISTRSWHRAARSAPECGRRR